MASDAVVSLGVVVAGLVILWTGWEWVDPVVSLIISIVILFGTWGLLRDSINLSLNAVPEGIDINQIQNYLQTLPTILDVHDLHIWGMSTTEAALSVHLIRTQTEDSDTLLQQIQTYLHDQHHIEHTTIQIEKGTYNCSLNNENSI